MQHTVRLRNIMVISWEIQRKKKSTRSKSLQSAWAITQNKDITIYYLVKRHNHEKYPNKTKPQELSLSK
jgi:hypothetical protein